MTIRALLWTVLAFQLSVFFSIAIHDTLYSAEDSQIVWTCVSDGDGICGDGPRVSVSLSEVFDWPNPIDISW